MSADKRVPASGLHAAEVWLLTGIMALALLLRLEVLRSLPVIETDGARYVAIAAQFRTSGSPWDPLFHPLYPIAIALAQPLVGDYELTGRLVSTLFGTALILPAYAVARALLGRGPAILSALLLAIHPGMVRSAAAVLSEATYIFWLVLGVWVGRHGLGGPRPPLLPVAGLLFGLAYLVRPEGLFYVVGLAFLAAVVGARARRLREFSLWAGLALVTFLLVGAPYLVYLHRTLGHWTLSGKVLHNLALDTGLRAAAGQSDFGFAMGHAGALARRTLENVFVFQKYALPELFPGLLILPLLPGILARARETWWGARPGALLAMALPPFVALAFHIESRVFLPTLPFLLPLVADGIIATAAWIAPRAPAGRRIAGLALVVVAALAPFTLRPILRPDPGPGLYRQAAQWVAATRGPEVVLLDRKPFIAFYSGRRFAPLPPVGPDELVAAARRAGAQLVVLDSQEFADRPLLVPLLYGPPPLGLEVLRDFDAGPTGRLRILGIRRDA